MGLTTLAGTIVVTSGLWLLGLAAASAFAPAVTARFLSGFASSARAHVLEQSLRIVAGAGFVMFAQHMAFTIAFEILGWILVGTSVVLLLLPWRWHQRFASWVVPFAQRHLLLYALGSLFLGLFVFYSLLAPVLSSWGS